jgi:hypothetical protein
MDTGVGGAVDDAEHISLCETLDRVLNKGVVIGGEVVISVADVDLVWLGLQVVLASVETARKIRPASVAWGQSAGFIAHGR